MSRPPITIPKTHPLFPLKLRLKSLAATFLVSILLTHYLQISALLVVKLIVVVAVATPALLSIGPTVMIPLLAEINLMGLTLGVLLMTCLLLQRLMVLLFT